MILQIVNKELNVIAKGKIKCNSASDFFKYQEDYIKKVTGSVPDYRIDTLSTIDNIMSSYKERKSGRGIKYKGSVSMEMSPYDDSDIEIVWEHAVDDNDNLAYIGVDLYKEGFVLSTGKMFTNFLGGNQKGFVTSIRRIRTGTRMSTGSKSVAKVFATKATLLKYLKEHKETLSYFADQNGYCYSVEFDNPLFERDYKQKKRTEKGKEKERQLDEEISVLLKEINNFEEPEKEPEFGTSAYEEAVRRMHELNIMPAIIQKFIKSNTIYCSEGGGIIYDLDDEGEKAVKDTKKYGTPYHVIKNGSMYTVLFVSESTEDWPCEVWDRKSEIAYANVWNSEFQMAEIGSVMIRPASGGVARIG